ncbi:hypothetical protein SAMN05216266_11540 [Amycolatopsis marina]|uniref:Zinc-finger n=1 Tax=Amycolatopsis marina TaxID=490629 RepID=A0A1I1BLA8_9PSEU|nr:hypothetical protein [Amycolatopsis marina]SFB51189.1 hypothetical protein SAMN05216266_11540 [Amycolatopsis marina]
MSTARGPRWATVGQQRHAVLAWERSGAWSYARSACGWLLTPSVYDRAPDAPVCPTCRALHPDLTAARLVRGLGRAVVDQPEGKR